VALGDVVAAAPEQAVAITLAQAALKGDKMDDVIRDATVMGVARIAPLVTERTVVPRAAMEQARVHDRWRRVALASAKQCGRAVVPAIDPPRDVEALLTDTDHACRLLLAEPATQAGGRALPETPPPSALIAIGPEGGWTADEVARAIAAGFVPLSLGARTLRAETAPLAALAVLSWVWKL
jgi:16S rRNA (uracil1498-N3)-methyltransferase